MRFFKLLIALAFCTAPAFGQGAYVQIPPVLSSVNGQLRGVQATLTVCAASTAGLPCAPALVGATFKDNLLTQPLANPFTTDGNGNAPTFALASGTYTITETALGFTGQSQQITVSCAVGACTAGGATFTTLTVSGTATVQQLGNIKWANSGTAGADCGAKINTQDTALGATPGEIWVDQSCGTTWTTAVSISSSHILRFTQGGTYTTNTITVANWGGIFGSPSSVQFVASQANTILKQANGTNGNPYIHGNGSNILFRDFAIDGNGSNNATGGADIDCLGSRCQFQSVSAINGPSHGLRLGDGTCCLNRGSGAKISNSHFVGNTGSGIFLNFTTDVWIVETEMDNNTRYGLEGIGIATPRVIGNDLGGNTLGGILISGATAFQSNGSIIVGNEFKNNLGIDLDIESDTGAPHANLGTITANSFQGLGGGAAANTFPAIRSNGGGGNAISANMVNSTTQTYKYCINIAEPAGGQELADQIVGNQCTGSFGTGSITTTASTHYTANFFSGTANQTDNIIVGTSVQHDTGSQAASGFVRISTGDTVCWRNNANGGDICLSHLSNDLITSTNGFQFPLLVSNTANPALSGNVRLASADSACWRNNANSADLCLAKTAGDVFQLNGIPITQTIVSGTKALNTASITTATCDAGLAATATGALSTDTVDWSFNAAPTATNKYGAFLVVYAVPSANTVTFYTCNPSATTSTPTAMTVNWSVRRP